MKNKKIDTRLSANVFLGWWGKTSVGGKLIFLNSNGLNLNFDFYDELK